MNTNQGTNTALSAFGPQHRKVIAPYKIKVDPKIRRLTLLCLRRVKNFCMSQINSKNISAYTEKNFYEVILCVDTAITFLKMRGRISNVQLTRFSSCLSRRQARTLTDHYLKNINDLTLLTRENISKLLRFKGKTPDPSFLIILGRRK